MSKTARHWTSFLVTLAAWFAAVTWFAYSPGQDFFSAIPLGHDGEWYSNYELSYEIQDNDIFFHGIGSSIEHAQQADIIFLGTSRVLFGLDWRTFEEFEAKQHVKMFNMAFAGITSGQFSLQVIQKWNLHPKLWVIDLFGGPDIGNMKSSFFDLGYNDTSSFGQAAVANVTHYNKITAYKNVIARDLRWRAKMMFGRLKQDPYRSAVTGNWWLDMWPNRASDQMPKMKADVGKSCPASSDEIANAQSFAKEIGGPILITQVPSIFSCDQRVNDIAKSLRTSAFTVDASQFSSTDGGGHLDGVSSRKYSEEFFAWLKVELDEAPWHLSAN